MTRIARKNNNFMMFKPITVVLAMCLIFGYHVISVRRASLSALLDCNILSVVGSLTNGSSPASPLSLDIKQVTPELESFYESNVQNAENNAWTCSRTIPGASELVIENKKYQVPPSFVLDMEQHEEFMKTTPTGKNARTTGVNPKDAMLLQQIIYKTCQAAGKAFGSCTTLETGFALGESAVAILNGHDEAKAQTSSLGNPRSTHYAVDPFHHMYDNTGARGAARYMAAHPNSRVDFFHMNETAALSLSYFTSKHTCFDVIFLDDGHRFEQNIIELSLAVDLTAVGSFIVMHDTWMPSIKATQSWIETNLNGVLKVVEQTISKNTLVLQKVAHDKREWDHFVPFSTA